MRLAQGACVPVYHAEQARLGFVPEVLHGLTIEPALGQAACHSRVAKQAQNAVDVANVFLLRLGVHDDIVEVDEAALPLHPGEDDVHIEATPQARAGKSELSPTAWLIPGVLMRSSACLAVPLSCIAVCV